MLSLVTRVMLLVVTVRAQFYRGMFVYEDIDRAPEFRWCNNLVITGSDHVAAIHVMESDGPTEPCHCVMYTSDQETVAQVIVKHHPLPAPSTNAWQLQYTLTPADWGTLGYPGLHLQVLSDKVTFTLSNGAQRSTQVAVAIEVEGGVGYMNMRCGEEEFTTTTTTTSTTTPLPTTTTSTTTPLPTTTIITTTPLPTTTTTTPPPSTTSTTTMASTTVPTTTTGSPSTTGQGNTTVPQGNQTTPGILPPARDPTPVTYDDSRTDHVTLLIIICSVTGGVILLVIIIGTILGAYFRRKAHSNRASDQEQVLSNGSEEGDSGIRPSVSTGDSEPNLSTGKDNVISEVDQSNGHLALAHTDSGSLTPSQASLFDVGEIEVHGQSSHNPSPPSELNFTEQATMQSTSDVVTTEQTPRDSGHSNPAFEHDQIQESLPTTENTEYLIPEALKTPQTESEVDIESVNSPKDMIIPGQTEVISPDNVDISPDNSPVTTRDPSVTGLHGSTEMLIENEAYSGHDDLMRELRELGQTE